MIHHNFSHAAISYMLNGKTRIQDHPNKVPPKKQHAEIAEYLNQRHYDIIRVFFILSECMFFGVFLGFFSTQAFFVHFFFFLKKE